MKNSILVGIFFTHFFGFSAIADECQFIRTALSKLPALGGEVKIPAGTYNCDSSIVLNQNGVRLTGVDKNTTILRLADHVHAPLVVIGEAESIQNGDGEWIPKKEVRFVKVSNLTLDGNVANHDTSKECGEKTCDDDPSSIRNNTLTIRRASDILVENVIAHSAISGGIVTEKHCERLVVRNFESFDNHFDGFAGYETEHSVFSKMYLHNNKGAGISLDLEFNNNTFKDSDLISNGDVGIFARDLSDNKFVRLNIQHSGNFGVFLSASDEGQATCPRNNEFDSVNINFSKGAAFRLNSNCQGNSIQGASNLCNNRDGGVSEDTPGTLISAGKIQCK